MIKIEFPKKSLYIIAQKGYTYVLPINLPHIRLMPHR